MSGQRERIINGAKQVLIESGADAFTISKVAEICNLDYIAVQSEFDNTVSLLTVVATSFLEEYCTYLTAYKIGERRRVEQALNPWLLSVLEYRESDSCAMLFKEFWAIALHNQEVRLVMDQYYRQLYQIIFDKLRTIAPDSCSAQRIELAICFLLPFIEGYGLARPTLPISVLLLSEQLSNLLRTVLLE